jgi:glycerophosphoryl diester phosphodiesterase
VVDQPLPNTNKSLLIIAHRGASATAPENTLSAFARAMHDGADGIELDVRLSRDGVPVVIHDSTLPGTRLRKRYVSRIALPKLKHTDIGTWFNRRHPELARLEYTRQTISTLDEVLQLMSNQPRKAFVIYVELKCGRSRKQNEKLVDATVACVQRHELRNQAVLISFNLHAVARIKQLDSSLRTGALFGQTSLVKSPARIVEAAVDCAADEVLVNHRIVSEKLVAAARAQNLPTAIWTVDDVATLERFRALGIQALMTNDPAKFLKAARRF